MSQKGPVIAMMMLSMCAVCVSGLGAALYFYAPQTDVTSDAGTSTSAGATTAAATSTETGAAATSTPLKEAENPPGETANTATEAVALPTLSPCGFMNELPEGTQIVVWNPYSVPIQWGVLLNKQVRFFKSKEISDLYESKYGFVDYFPISSDAPITSSTLYMGGQPCYLIQSDYEG